LIETELAIWLSNTFPGHQLSAPKLIAGDASPRRYYRVAARAGSDHHAIVAAISPPTEKNAEFIAVRQLLADAGVRVPVLYAADVDAGFLALEDLGDATLLPILASETVDDCYRDALSHLRCLACLNAADIALPEYSRELLQSELNVFMDWFVNRLLVAVDEGNPEAPARRQIFSELSAVLLDSARAQPQVLVHRDFHSRNLMVLDDKQLAVIDFQDAVMGPVTYDPVSLLKDCYIAWPREQQLAWLGEHQQALTDAGLIAPVSTATFVRWFDLMGLQRHIKVLGVFARLSLRDNKHGYLDDLPLVLFYTREALALYRHQIPQVAAFEAWFDAVLMPRIASQPWYRQLP